jgi:N6-adenosine-specific RNA methylase IME4
MTTHEAMLPLFSPMVRAPEKLYRTLVADPPWRYDSKLQGLRGATDYPTMTQEQLMTMPVGLWGLPDSHLYLWTTDAFMVQAHQVAKAWGYEVKNILTWVKGRDQNSVRMGVGFYYRHATEHVLFCVRGSLSVLNHGQPNVFFAPRTGHSEKPAAFYDLAERMSPGPYLDVFARKQRFNWDTFGDEAFDFREHGNFQA